ncbi:MAG: MATE family efflux transporter [Bacteroidales bacterium]|nr:MATE family efflux transporter [Bacteroidales bacterium]
MNKEIFRLAIPNIISNITVPLLGMADLAILGHLDSEKYLGAIALGGTIFNVIYWSFGFLRMGTSGFVSQAYGKNDASGIAAVLSHSLLIALLGGLVLVLLQYPIQKISFYFLNGSTEVKSLAMQYFYIRIFAAPATLSLYALNGWFTGMQDAKTPMFVAIVINILNIAFNVLFVYGFDLKSDGVAWGTLLAQYGCFFLAVFFIFKKYRVTLKNIHLPFKINVNLMNELFKVNKDIFIRTLVLIAVVSFFTVKSAAVSDQILAVNTILLQYLLLFSFIMDGFAYAAEALAGKYYEARNRQLLSKMIRYIFFWGALMSIAFTGLYLFFNDKILVLLTNNSVIIEKAQPFLFWVSLIPLAGFAGFLWDGIYIGTTASKLMRNTMLISALVFYFPVYYFLVNEIDNHALWLAMILFLAARGISQTIFSRKAVYSF